MSIFLGCSGTIVRKTGRATLMTTAIFATMIRAITTIQVTIRAAVTIKS